MIVKSTSKVKKNVYNFALFDNKGVKIGPHCPFKYRILGILFLRKQTVD